MKSAACLLIASGPRAAEQLLWSELERRLPTSAKDLALPIRIVVPSRSLRLHLGRFLVRSHGKPLLAVEVGTLFSLAVEVISRAGLKPPRGALAHGLLVRRRARAENLLHSSLDHLDDGYAAVAATVRDLADAGLEAAHAEPLLEFLESLDEDLLPKPVLGRAQALVRVAAATDDDADELGVSRSAALFKQAAELITSDASRFLPTRWLAIHGFADVTGVAGDLLDALVRSTPATVIVDCPPDPAGDQLTSSFPDRFINRIAAVTGKAPASSATSTPARIECLEAPDRESEVRAALEMVADEIEAGANPESMAIVARELSGYASLLRRHAQRLGLPLSAVGETVPGGAGARQLAALSELFNNGLESRIEIYLEALGESLPNAASLVLTLHHRGITRIGQLAAVEPTDDNPELPLVAGWDQRGRVLRPCLEAAALNDLIDSAKTLEQTLEQWPDLAPAASHLEHSLRLITAPSATMPHQVLSALAADLPATWPITREEWLLLIRRSLERGGREPLAGDGGGLRVLTVMEARGMAFEHLFVLGLNRDVFPRSVHEDPLLPDSVRARLAPLLPDIPIKQRGWEEERYLFAQLTAAAPQVTVSFASNDGGKTLPASPFLARLGLENQVQPGLWQSRSQGQRPRPALENVILAGLAGDRVTWSSALDTALSEARQRWPKTSTPTTESTAASARRALLDVVDPLRPADHLGVFTGCVGVARKGDPRSRRLSVTTVEAIARCPWQAFLRKVLRITPAPDPLVNLPDVESSSLGLVVHQVLEMIVRDALPVEPSKGSKSEHQPVRVPWPDEQRLVDLIEGAAHDIAADQGSLEYGINHLLALRARPLLESARIVDWADGSAPMATGVEQWLVTHVDGNLKLSCRADRTELIDDLHLVTDYKTGKPVSSKTLTRHIAAGTHLQAAAYAFHRSDHNRVQGRYVYLSDSSAPGAPPATVTTVDSEDTALRQAFEQAVKTAVAAWEIGTLVPRLANGNKDSKADACRFCEVRQACLTGDSSYRRQVLSWRDSADDESPLGKAARALWWLGDS